ncbi:MAG: hypothetical protein OXI60_05200 [Acidiferrobacterales bacterium]|nr:hypothetical protein [Acidiferrobacterales bacterium]
MLTLRYEAGRYGASELHLGVKATRTLGDNEAPDDALGLELKARW